MSKKIKNPSDVKKTNSEKFNDIGSQKIVKI